MIVFFASPTFLTVLLLLVGFVALVYNRTGLGGILCGAGLLLTLSAAAQINSVMLAVFGFCAVILIGDAYVENKENQSIRSCRGLFPAEWNSPMKINEVYAFIDEQIGWHTKIKETAKSMAVIVSPIAVSQMALAMAEDRQTELWQVRLGIALAFVVAAFALLYFFVLPRRKFYTNLQNASEEKARSLQPDEVLEIASVLTAKMFDHAYAISSGGYFRQYETHNSECLGCMRAGYLLSLRGRYKFPKFDPKAREKILHEAEKTIYEKQHVNIRIRRAFDKVARNEDPLGAYKKEGDNLLMRDKELLARQLELARALCMQDAAYADALMDNLPKWIGKREDEFDKIRMIRKSQIIFRSCKSPVVFDGENFHFDPDWETAANLRAELDREIKNAEIERNTQQSK